MPVFHRDDRNCCCCSGKSKVVVVLSTMLGMVGKVFHLSPPASQNFPASDAVTIPQSSSKSPDPEETNPLLIFIGDHNKQKYNIKTMGQLPRIIVADGCLDPCDNATILTRSSAYIETAFPFRQDGQTENERQPDKRAGVMDWLLRTGPHDDQDEPGWWEMLLRDEPNGDEMLTDGSGSLPSASSFNTASMSDGER